MCSRKILEFQTDTLSKVCLSLYKDMMMDDKIHFLIFLLDVSVVLVNVTISKHLGVFESLLFVNVRIIRAGYSHRPGLDSEMIEADHLIQKPSPNVQFLHQIRHLLSQLHGFLHVPPGD